jgi:hypothetical protein
MSFNLGTPIEKSVTEFKKFNLMQVGLSGSGKTTRMLDAVRFGPLYVFDFDGKVGAAIRGEEAKYKDLGFYDDYKKLGIPAAMQKLAAIKAEFAAGRTPCATIGVDTFTLFNEAMYLHALGSKIDNPAYKANFDDWGVIKNNLINFFNILLSLPCNVIVNAHVVQGEKDDGTSGLVAAGSGGFAKSLQLRIGDSQYLYLEHGKYKIKAGGSSAFPVNSNIPKKFMDATGLVNVAGLKCFDDYAFKVKGN